MGIDGVALGHWTEPDAKTGCTVVVLPPGTVASGEVRGGAPATREFALLEPTKTVENVDAVVLTGGSAFGLAAADGVMSWLEEQGRGFPTKAGPVPIVVAMGLYDLMVGRADVRPGPGAGRAAAESSGGDLLVGGLVGAGTGATVGKWGGPETTKPGGFAVAEIAVEELVVWAGIAVNAVGFLSDGTETRRPEPPFKPADQAGSNTTVGVVVTNAKLSKSDCNRLAVSGHDGFARAIYPAHTAMDGDALVVAATGTVEADLMHLAAIVQATVVRAIRSLRTD